MRGACSTRRNGSTAASPPASIGAGEAQRADSGRAIRSRASSARSIVKALQQNPLFITAALPLHVFPPLFNRYSGGQSFGSHVDNAIRTVPGTAHRIRTDLSATLFLSQPDEYDGGELMIEDTYGVHSVKLPAGSMVLYPSTSLHHVRPVTRGARVSSFFWLQSMVRDDGERTLLFDLDSAIRSINQSAARASGGRCS